MPNYQARLSPFGKIPFPSEEPARLWQHATV
jgi:hypothetical protein